MIKRGAEMARRKSQGDGIPTGRMSRTLPVVQLAARTTGESIVASLRRREPPPEVYARRADRYVEVLGRSKGALMKAAQMLSVLPVLSTDNPDAQAAFQTALTRLQADAPPMAPELAAEMIEQELGAPPSQIFAEFDMTPLAAASIGQVHLARHHDGRALAVKVQYPGVADAIRSDLRNTELMSVFFQFLRSVVPLLSRSNPKALAAEISARLTEELDYRLEAANQAFFADAYRGHPFIHVPEVLPELSSSRVLTQEFADGMLWTDATGASQQLRNTWGEAVYRFAHGSLRRFGVSNADPNPGNYVFHDDGTVSFIDFGCVKRFDDAMVAMVREIFRVGLSQDGEALWRLLVEGGTFDARHGLTPDELFEHFRVRFEVFMNGPQPLTMTPETLKEILAHEFSNAGHGGAWLRSVKNTDAWFFYTRIELGVYGVLAGLQSSNEVLAIVREMDFGDPPGTPLGEADAAFWAARVGSM